MRKPDPHFEINFNSRGHDFKISIPLARKIINHILNELGVEKALINVRFVGLDEIIGANERYLRHKGPTDVIAFEYDPKELGLVCSSQESACGKVIAGDILLCVDIAVTQAQVYRTSPSKELVRYLIHGILHICSYSDSTKEKKARMKVQEDKILKKVKRTFDIDLLIREIK